MSPDPVVVCRLDLLLAERGMTLTELSRRTGVTLANLSILKTNKAKAVRFTTVAAICTVLDIAPGDLFELQLRSTEPGGGAASVRRPPVHGEAGS